MKKNLTIFLSIFVTLTAFGQIPLAQYPCNGNADDTTSNSYDGALFGGVVVADRYGEPFGALQFDGNDYINVPHSSSLMFSSSFSASVWFKTNMTGVGILVEKFNGMANGVKDAGYTLAINSNEVYFIVYSGTGTSVDPPDAYRVTSGISVTDNNWHQAIGVWDDAKDSVFLYIDGVLKAKKYCPVPPGSNTRGLYMGKRYNNDLYYTGSIDDVRIYPFALASAEAVVIYSGIKGQYAGSNGQSQAYFDFQNKNLISSVSDDLTAEIYSIDGRLIGKEIFTGNVSLQYLPSGVYFVNLSDTKGVVSNLEIMIN